MEYQLKEFATNDYKLLLVLYRHQLNINGVNVVPMTQKEISEECSLSYPTTNKSITALIEKGCLRPAESKGRYIITPKGLAFIEEFEKVRTIEEKEVSCNGKS